MQLWLIVILVGIAVSIVQWGLRRMKVRMPKTLFSRESTEEKSETVQRDH